MLTALTKARGVLQRSAAATIGIRSVGTYPVPAPLVGTTRYDAAGYESTYAQSLADPAAFWGEHARERLEWITPFTDAKTMDVDLNTGHIKVRGPCDWFTAVGSRYTDLFAARVSTVPLIRVMCCFRNPLCLSFSHC